MPILHKYYIIILISCHWKNEYWLVIANYCVTIYQHTILGFTSIKEASTAIRLLGAMVLVRAISPVQVYYTSKNTTEKGQSVSETDFISEKKGGYKVPIVQISYKLHIKPIGKTQRY